MNRGTLGLLLLLPAFGFLIVGGTGVSAEEKQHQTFGEYLIGSGTEPDGREGFSEAVGVEPADGAAGGVAVAPTDVASGSTAGVASDAATASDDAVASTGEKATLDGTVDVDTYLNIRTGPWGKIIGGLNNLAKIKIVSKEGDWFKIIHNGEIAYIHAYYVNAPGYPSHQGVEPPSGIGSDQSPESLTGDPGSSATVDNGTFGAEPCTPMPDSVSSNFGPRDIEVGSSNHEGIDLPVPTGTRINALGNGVVTESGYSEGGGNYVYIKYDNGYTSFYCHLDSVNVSDGQRVAIGQDVATSDNTGSWTTGSHLHMGVMDSSGSYVNPRDIPGLEFPPLVE